MKISSSFFPSTNSDLKRRQFLQTVLSVMASGTGIHSSYPCAQETNTAILPAHQGIHALHGEVYHNGQLARVGVRIQPGDTFESKVGATAVLVMQDNVFLLREQSHLELSPTNKRIHYFLRMVAGGLLAVFGHSNKQRTIHTSAATIGIRGTGLYLEVANEQTYICDCYGTVDIIANGSPIHYHEIVHADYHHARRMQNTDSKQPWISQSSMHGHQDHELIMLEALAGRRPPTTFSHRQSIL
ncbi:hypothetical protein CCP3SC5AM1_1090005 [Gammaproteobacteria bacterium]